MATGLPMKRMLAAALLAACGAGWAGLGDRMAVPPDAPGVTTTQARTAAGASYTVVQRQLDSNTTVREYLDTGGTVFAVSWAGPFLPDLRSLLGSHFAALEQHAAASGRSSAVSIQRPDLGLVSAGRMGAFQGRAWLPRQLPAGFDLRVIQ